MLAASYIIFVLSFGIGCIHTLFGPDHYVPFIAMAKARNWRLPKTLWVTTICGLGHVMSAAVIGLVAVSIGWSLQSIKHWTFFRGEIATFILIGFGLLYGLYGLYSAYRHKHHHHHLSKKRELTPWILFIVFILGPCEPLIPLIMYPAIKGSMLNVGLVVLFFGLATLITMLSVVTAALFGLHFVKMRLVGRWGHAIAGAIIFICGIVIWVFGL